MALELHEKVVDVIDKIRGYDGYQDDKIEDIIYSALLTYYQYVRKSAGDIDTSHPDQYII
jgi:hypothetical protein